MQFPEFAEVEHGEHCDCLVLASAAGVAPSVVNFSYCRLVLQKRWRMRCNHGHRVTAKHVTPVVSARDPHDAVQAILVANAIASSDRSR